MRWMKRSLGDAGRLAHTISLRLGRVPSLIYLGCYLLLIFSFAYFYYSLPEHSFYHPTAQFEYDAFNGDADRLVSELGDHIRDNLIKYYETDHPTIEGWNVDARSLQASSLSVKDFPEEFSFRLFVPLTQVNNITGRVLETSYLSVVMVPLRPWMSTGNTVYLLPKPTEPSLPENFEPLPSLAELLPITETTFESSEPVLALPLDLYYNIEGFANGYRGFPAEVSGQFQRMLYFSASVATSNTQGDILPVTQWARLLVTLQAVFSLMIVALFLNALAIDIKNI